MHSSIFRAGASGHLPWYADLMLPKLEDRPLACQGRQPSRLSKIGDDRRNASLPATVA